MTLEERSTVRRNIRGNLESIGLEAQGLHLSGLMSDARLDNIDRAVTTLLRLMKKEVR